MDGGIDFIWYLLFWTKTAGLGDQRSFWKEGTPAMCRTIAAYMGRHMARKEENDLTREMSLTELVSGGG